MSMDNGFDPAKDDINREKHGLPLAFGHRIFGDADHLIIPSNRKRDGEERDSRSSAPSGRNCLPVCSPGEEVCPVHIRKEEQQR